MTRFKCEVCDLTLNTEKSWEEHLAGKKHQQRAEKRTQMESLARRSLYLNHFKHPVDTEELAKEMGQYGEVERILPDKSGKGAFAVVEFKEEDAAQNLLHSVQRLKIGKSLVRIQPRKVDFGGADAAQLLHNSEHQGQINAEQVLECIQQAGPGLAAQLDALIAKFAISTEIANERAQFAQRLQQFLQPYFACPLHVRVFGSSSNGLGFANSDLDVNMVFEQDLQDNDSGSSIGSPAAASNHGENEDAAMEQDIDAKLQPETIAQNPMDRATFTQLSKTNRVRLLNRLMNVFRKQHSLVTAHVPVPDARTPVVRFLLRHPRALPCELSVQNLLGESKANLVRDLVRAESTGKLWRLLFLLKLWASANGLFSPEPRKKPANKKGEKPGHKGEETSSQKSGDTDEPVPNNQHAHPKAHWNSYSLALCTIGFLQAQRRIPPISQLIRPNSRTIGGWAIEYDLLFFQLDEAIPALLKGLFTFLYQQLKEDRVLVLREGVVLEAKQFKEKWLDAGGDPRLAKLWRFSAVNVQDPLELSHNVTANVSRESLARLRWKVTFAISAIKRSPEDLQQLFQLESVRKLHEQRRAEKETNKAKRGTQGDERQDEEEDMDVDEEGGKE